MVIDVQHAQLVETAVLALVRSALVPTGVRADLSTLVNPESGTFIIAREVDADVVAAVVIASILPALGFEPTSLDSGREADRG